MDTDVQNLKVVYEKALADRKASGSSPESVRVYEEVVRRIDGSASVAEWRSVMERENLFFQLGRAEAADHYRAIALAARDTIYPMCYDTYIELVGAILAAASDEEIGRVLETYQKQIEETEATENRKRAALIRCVGDVLEYLVVGDDISGDARRTFRERLLEVGGIDGFAKMLVLPHYAVSVPLDAARTEEVVAAARRLAGDPPARGPKGEARDEALEILAQIGDASLDIDDYSTEELRQMRDAHKAYLDAYPRIRSTEDGDARPEAYYIAYAPIGQPGPYRFEKIIGN